MSYQLINLSFINLITDLNRYQNQSRQQNGKRLQKTKALGIRMIVREKFGTTLSRYKTYTEAVRLGIRLVIIPLLVFPV